MKYELRATNMYEITTIAKADTMEELFDEIEEYGDFIIVDTETEEIVAKF